MSTPAPPPAAPPPDGQRHLFGMEPPVRRSIRMWVFIAMAAVLLVGLLMGFGPLALVSYQLKGYCEGLAPGTTLADVQAQAAARSYELGPLVAGEVELRSSRARIKATCDLRFDDAGRLLSSKVNDG